MQTLDDVNITPKRKQNLNNPFFQGTSKDARRTFERAEQFAGPLGPFIGRRGEPFGRCTQQWDAQRREHGQRTETARIIQQFPKEP